MRSMQLPTDSFPLSEGVGVFVGVIAWDLLVEGQCEITKAALVAAPFTLAWFAWRCWKEYTRNKRH